jgi:hypothetical protein
MKKINGYIAVLSVVFFLPLLAAGGSEKPKAIYAGPCPNGAAVKDGAETWCLVPETASKVSGYVFKSESGKLTAYPSPITRGIIQIKVKVLANLSKWGMKKDQAILAAYNNDQKAPVKEKVDTRYEWFYLHTRTDRLVAENSCQQLILKETAKDTRELSWRMIFLGLSVLLVSFLAGFVWKNDDLGALTPRNHYSNHASIICGAHFPFAMSLMNVIVGMAPAFNPSSYMAPAYNPPPYYVAAALAAAWGVLIFDFVISCCVNASSSPRIFYWLALNIVPVASLVCVLLVFPVIGLKAWFVFVAGAGIFSVLGWLIGHHEAKKTITAPA